jgi:putative SOS response-associated peptidase YedK
MPVILTPETGAVWIDPDVNDPEALQGLLKPFPAEETAFHEISRLVNNRRNNRPELILPIAG